MRAGSRAVFCLVLGLELALVVGACGFDGAGELVTGDDATPGADAGLDGASADGAAGDASSDGVVVFGDSSPDAPVDATPTDGTVTVPRIVYGHSVTTLYRLDPVAKTFATVGTLAGCSNISDIAVDRDGNIVGVGDALYSISATTGACTVIANRAQPFTLTFVAAGTVSAAGETLVAYLDSDYVRIDRATGVVTQITANAIAPYTPSGDLVSVAGSGTYVSVTGPACGDCLLEVNPTTGAIVKNLGSIGQSGIVGLGLWGGVVYGFAGSGETYAIAIGASSVTSTLVPNANKPSGGWIGGGSTTAAPN